MFENVGFYSCSTPIPARNDMALANSRLGQRPGGGEPQLFVYAAARPADANILFTIMDLGSLRPISMLVSNIYKCTLYLFCKIILLHFQWLLNVFNLQQGVDSQLFFRLCKFQSLNFCREY